MATVKKGVLIRSPEWAKHLRPYGKRRFWKKHRKAEEIEGDTQFEEWEPDYDAAMARYEAWRRGQADLA